MKKGIFWLAILFITLPLLIIFGCGGEDSSSSSPAGIDQQEGLEYSAYLFAPDQAGESVFRASNPSISILEDGLLVLDSPDQAPGGYSPAVNCKVILPDGTFSRTNGEGRFIFSGLPTTTSENGIPLLIDPGESNFPRLAQAIIPVLVPQRQAIPQEEALHLVIKPSSLLISTGSKYLYQAYVMDDLGFSYRIPPGQVTWSFEPDEEGKNIGYIENSGLFRALAEGRGKVTAEVRAGSLLLSASGEITVVDRQKIAQIYGQVTDSLFHPLAGVIVLVSGFENGTVTDGQGRYFFPHVPTDESLTLTFIYRGTVVKVVEEIQVSPGESKQINVNVNTFHESGRVSYQPDAEQTEGRILFQPQGLAGPFSVDEFPSAREFELLGVAEADPNFFQRLKDNPESSFFVLVEGTLSSAGELNTLPQVQVTSLQLLHPVDIIFIQTMRGEVSWTDGQGLFRGPGRNPGVTPETFTLHGLENFTLILDQLQNSPGRWYPCKLIGRVDRLNHVIDLFEISLFEIFVEGRGDIYYDPEFMDQGAILMEPEFTIPGAGPGLSDQPWMLLNVDEVSPAIYSLLTSCPHQRFSGIVSGMEAYDPALREYAYPVKVFRIQLASSLDTYLVHKRGKIWADEQNQVWFTPLLSLANAGNSYLLQGMESWGDIFDTLENFLGTIYYCFLSGEILDTGEIAIWQLELLEPVAAEQNQSQTRARPDGIAFYVVNRELPIGGRYLYQKITSNGFIEDKLYELSNMDRGYQETADILKAQPGLIIQITLNYTEVQPTSGQTPIQKGPTRIYINEMSVLEDVDPILSVSGNLIYHSWENVVELIARSPSMPEGQQESFILQSIPQNLLPVLLNYPNRFIPVAGMIQVFQRENRSIQATITARVLNLQILVGLGS
ncbi:MAG: carboxypeptidase-like regulatory domain-containing protein [bacterium]